MISKEKLEEFRHLVDQHPIFTLLEERFSILEQPFIEAHADMVSEKLKRIKAQKRKRKQTKK